MSNAAAITPAQLTVDASGAVRSARYDDVYHSSDGAFAQAQHVFLHGNRLPERWQKRRAFAIVETGFGLGVNFLATWAALRADRDPPQRLHYIAAERHPPRSAELKRFHARSTQESSLAQRLIERWPPLTRGFHRLELDAGRVVLTLLLGDAATMLAELDVIADAFYLDGFAPSKNPAMWSEALFREVARLSGAEATAATWTVAGAVRARLAAAGFVSEKRPGFGRKREMLVARRGGARTVARALPARRAIVIGAGLAGAWCAHVLARRGWEVDVFERAHGAAQCASGNAVGAVRPVLNLADNDNARFGRAAFLFACQQMSSDSRLASGWSQTGVLHVPTTSAHAERMARIHATHAFPSEYVDLIEATDASERIRRPITAPSWWIGLGGWAQPATLCEALLQRDGIRCLFDREATDVIERDGRWHVMGAHDSVLAAASTVVIAAGLGASRLPSVGLPPLVPVRGQVTYLPASVHRALHVVVCGDGYVAPMQGGGHCVGATFQPNDTDDRVRADDHGDNLARLERMLPGFGAGLSAASLQGRAGVRAATADRLPACGALRAGHRGGADGLHVLAGLGARGLVYAPLCAEVLASQLEGEPNPVERRLIDALDPSRLHPSAAPDRPTM